MNGLVTAIRTLSILPIHGKDAENFATALPWFPVVGLLLGSLLALVASIPGSIPAEAAAALILVAGVLLTRGFHLDGLADCADGFGGGYTRERVLEIMKDSAIGAFGTIAIVLALLLKWVALTHVIKSGNLSVLVLAYTLSRAMQVEQMVRLPYARANGTAAAFVQGATASHRFIVLATAGLVAVLLKGLDGILYLALAWLAAFLFGQYCKKRVGGITGDLLGATSEITETLVLFIPFFA